MPVFNAADVQEDRLFGGKLFAFLGYEERELFNHVGALFEPLVNFILDE